MAPYYPFMEDNFSRGIKAPLVTLAPHLFTPKTTMSTIISFSIAVVAGVFFGLVVVCAICRIGWFRPQPEVVGLPDWSQVQWRRIRMRVPQLSTITDWESNPGSPDHERQIDDVEEGSISAPLLESR